MAKVKRFVAPVVFHVGATYPDYAGIRKYLEYKGRTEFLDAIDEAEVAGVTPGEWLISLYAKLCYASLVVGDNANVTQVRDIKGNLENLLQVAHGSVLEAVSVNFIVTDCSRVYTHEQVRHRVGAHYSQTSGRYCRIDIGGLQVVWDPILDGCEDIGEHLLQEIERGIYLMECRKGMRMPPYGISPDDLRPTAWLPDQTYPSPCEIGVLLWNHREAMPGDVCMRLESMTTDGEYYPTLSADDSAWLRQQAIWVPNDKLPFTTKKKLTSAFRRFAPNGQSNEMGMTLNIRVLRHTILMRTARHAEYEIRVIFNQIYRIMKERYPLLFSDAKEREFDGLTEVYGMRMAPYDLTLDDYSDEELLEHLTTKRPDAAEVFKKLGSGAEELPAPIEAKVARMVPQDLTLDNLVVAPAGPPELELKVPIGNILHVGDEFPFKFGTFVTAQRAVVLAVFEPRDGFRSVLVRLR